MTQGDGSAESAEMLYGLFLSAQGARAQSTRLDVIANNLANASTNGFKRSLAVFQGHKPYDVVNNVGGDVPGNLNASTGGISVAGIHTDHREGPLRKTGGPLDVAIVGDGFFQVADAQGRKFLTRNGSFVINSAGDLLQQGSGHKVLSTDGTPISFGKLQGKIQIAADGSINQILNGQSSPLGRLALVKPASLSGLRKVGMSLYRSPSTVTPVDKATVKQGYLEGSGVKPVKEMLAMIEASRSFETNINMMKFQDDALSRLLQSASGR